MNSIYIESDKIKARKDIVEWLDGCGAAIKHLKNIIENTYIIFGVSKANGVKYWKYNTFLAEAQSAESMQCATALAFCQGVARIMGKPEPTFGEVVSDKIAIVYSLLNKDQIGWLKNNIGIENDGTPMHFFNCVFLSNAGNCDYLIIFQNGSTLSDLGFAITESPTEFLKYVAQQTGKEYKATISKMETVEHVNNSYKFKTYRILDSLDGIPLDTRFKLSEWIPPYKSEVVFTYETQSYLGKVYAIYETEIVIIPRGETIGLRMSLDGEWMRIV